MSIDGRIFIFKATRSDKKRDSLIPLPEGVTQYRDISYGPHGQSNLLDVYIPEGTTAPLPTIVSIHGGGYVYGSKEIYRRYGMDLARRGFAFVNFNYRLAPKWKFPTPLHDTNNVMNWIIQNARQYHLDPQRIFIVGDSAGAQMTSQYAAMQSNPEFAAHFDMKLAKIRILAVGLNCGRYDAAFWAKKENRKGIQLDYFGKNFPEDDPRVQVLQSIDGRYPPAHITTGTHDFLREQAEPMWQLLTERGVDAQWKCYGREDDEKISHVFHVNILLPEAIQCNDDQTDFFKKYL